MSDSERGFVDAEYPADPYPGAAPDYSFVHLDGIGHRLRPDPTTLSGWRVSSTDEDLDDWLADRGAAPLAGRVPLLAYGSNRCPSKISWMRENLGLDGPAALLAARTEGIAAVWAAGFRKRDGQRPAVLAADPGNTETHAIWLATPEQVAVLDRCEGRGERYRLVRLRTGEVHTEDGARIDAPWTYLAAAPIRAPLLVDGGPIRCTTLDQREAAQLEGAPAAADGLDADEVAGNPHPDEWPSALFSYGLLQPGRVGWPLVEPHLAGRPHRTSVPGRVYDTGLGWPALLLDDLLDDPRDGARDDLRGNPPHDPRHELLDDPQHRTPRHQPPHHQPGTAIGTLIPVHAPATLMPKLDEYEGPDYRRTRLVTLDGTVAWAYVWTGPRQGLRPS